MNAIHTQSDRRLASLCDIGTERIKHIVVVRHNADLDVYTRPMDIGYFQQTWGSEELQMLDGLWMSCRKTDAYISFVVCLKD